MMNLSGSYFATRTAVFGAAVTGPCSFPATQSSSDCFCPLGRKVIRFPWNSSLRKSASWVLIPF